MPPIQPWRCCAYQVPRAEVVYACQISALFIVLVTAVINLTFRETLHTELWVALTCSAIGYILPQPKLKNVPDIAKLERERSVSV